jgi:lysophospholipid acyltransferase (LPLAT)-like uncharacterized protein
LTDFWYRLSLRILPGLAAGLLRLWFASCRLTTHGSEQIKSTIAQNGRGIATFWHYSFLYNFYYLRGQPAAVMVSTSRDGEYIARLAVKLGHIPIRGSANKRGFRALREMLTQLQQGNNAGIVADGSQGPARRVQPGCILMASRSGQPIFPMAWAASHYIAFNSWDRTVIPLPFAKIVLHHGQALHVPPNLSHEAIEGYRLKLEETLNTLYHSAWQELGKAPHDQELHSSSTHRSPASHQHHDKA